MLRILYLLAGMTLALTIVGASPAARAQQEPAPPDPFTGASELAPPVTQDEPAAQQPVAPPASYGGQGGVVVQPAPVAQPYAVSPDPYAVPAPRPLPARSDGAFMADVGGGLLGLGLGATAMYLMIRNSGTFEDALGAIIFGPVIAFWLTDVGIFSFGRLTGGRGSFWLTTAGTAAGAGLGALLGFRVVASLADYSKAGVWGGLAIMSAFAIAGGTAVFELTDRRSRRRAAQGYAILPMVTPTSRGATVGLVGRF